MSELDFIYKRKSIRDYKDAVIPKEAVIGFKILPIFSFGLRCPP